MSNWKQRLMEIFNKDEYVEEEKTPQEMNIKFVEMNMKEFFKSVVIPTYNDLKKEIEEHGRTVVVDIDDTGLYSASLTVFSPSETKPEEQTEEFYFEIRGRAYKKGGFAFPEHADENQPRTSRIEVLLRNGSIEEYDINEVSKEDILECFINEYAKWMNY